MTRAKFILTSVLACWLLAACSTGVPTSTNMNYAADDMAQSGAAPVLRAKEAELAELAQPPAAGQDAAKAEQPAQPKLPENLPQKRLIIRNADVSLTVKDVRNTVNEIIKLAESNKGFVVSQSINSMGSNSNRYLNAQMAIRVDPTQLNAVLAKLRSLAVEVTSEQVTGQDVTAEFVDLQAQVKNLEAAEQQLTRILSDSVRTEDVMNVFKQLTETRGQIEQLKGRMKFLQESANLSLVNITLQQDLAGVPVEVARWSPGTQVRNAFEALVATLRGLVDLLIWLVIYVLPIVLVTFGPVLLVGWLLLRWLIRKSKTSSKTNHVAQEK